MGEVFSSFVRFFVRDEVSAEADRVERAARDAAEGMDEAAEAAGTRLKGGFEKAKTAAGTFVRGVAGLGAGVAGAIGGLMGLASATQTTVEDMGKLEVAFSDAGHSSETAQAVFNDMVGILGETDQAVEAANHLAELTNSELDGHCSGRVCQVWRFVAARGLDRGRKPHGKAGRGARPPG